MLVNNSSVTAAKLYKNSDLARENARNLHLMGKNELKS
jgi:hypothetical protein